MVDGIVETISPDTVRRVLALNCLKPWREHSWLSSSVPRDAAYAAAIRDIHDLYTRVLAPHEVVLCVDETTQAFSHGSEQRQPCRRGPRSRFGSSRPTGETVP
jgi:hypothetical protein